MVNLFKLKLPNDIAGQSCNLAQSVGLFACLWYNPMATVLHLDKEAGNHLNKLIADSSKFSNRFEFKYAIQGTVALLTAIREGLLRPTDP